MSISAQDFAVSQVVVVALRFRDLQQVGRDCAAVVLPESRGNVMAGGPLFGSVERVWVLQERLHPSRVRDEHSGHVRLGVISLRKPPHRIDCVLGSDLTLVHPLDRRGELRRVVPEELFGQPVTDPIAEVEEHPEVVERADRPPPFVGAPQIENEATCLFENRKGKLPKLAEPGPVLGLVLIAVALLTKKREGGARDNEVNGSFWQSAEYIPAIS